MRKTTGQYTKQKLFQPTKISQLIIEVTVTQEEVIEARRDSTVREDTIDTKTIHPEDQDVGAAIKMVILVQTIHIRTKST
jgi:hypothetical protein